MVNIPLSSLWKVFASLFLTWYTEFTSWKISSHDQSLSAVQEILLTFTVTGISGGIKMLKTRGVVGRTSINCILIFTGMPRKKESNHPKPPVIPTTDPLAVMDRPSSSSNIGPVCLI